MNYGRDGLADYTHVAETHKSAFPYNATETFQQPLVGQEQKDQNHMLVANPSQKHLNKNIPTTSGWTDEVKKPTM